MARAYASFVRESAKGAAPSRIVTAMTGHPFEVAGTGRLCTEVMVAGRGDILVKLGAEGVYGAAWLSKGWGIGIKVEDGNRRALEVALIGILGELGALSGTALDGLASFALPAVTNTRDEVVGHAESAIALEWHQ